MERTNSQNMTSSVETVALGVTQESFHDGKILVFTVADIRRETVDAWSSTALKTLEAWPSDEPFLTIQDFSGVDNFSFTPYIREKSEQMVTPRPEIQGRTAVVVKKSFGARLVQVFLLAKKNALRQRKLFFSRDEAMKWLEEWLDPTNVPSKDT